MKNYVNGRLAFEAFGAIGIAVTMLSVGYSISSGQWEANIDFLENRNDQLQTKLDASNEENASLKVELSEALFDGNSMLDERYRLIGGYRGSESVESLAKELEESMTRESDESSQEIQVTVKQGDTASLFDGDLFLTVIATDYEGDPLRHTVIGKISTLGEEEKKLERVEPGYETEYAGYHVRVMSSGTLSATFLVNKMVPDISEQTS